MTTMILEPPPMNTRLGVGFDSNRSPAADAQACPKPEDYAEHGGLPLRVTR